MYVSVAAVEEDTAFLDITGGDYLCPGFVGWYNNWTTKKGDERDPRTQNALEISQQGGKRWVVNPREKKVAFITQV